MGAFEALTNSSHRLCRWYLTYTVTLAQTFQVASGSATVSGRVAPLQNVKLLGDEISFSFSADWGEGLVKHEFKGRVDGDSMSGSAALSGSRTQGQYDWSAMRAPLVSRLGER